MGERTLERIAGGRRWTALAAASFGAALGATILVDRLWRRRGTPEEQLQEEAGSRAGRGTPRQGPSARSREAGYETTDARIRSLVVVMVVALCLMGSGLAAVFAMFAHFDRGFRAADAALTAAQRAPIDPPLPHLQAHPYRDLDATLMEQSHRLTSYGWDDPGHTTAHIPISRAMEAVVGKPLDGSGQAQTAPATSYAFPAAPAVPALEPQNKPADDAPGEGRAGAVAPSFDPRTGAR